MYSQVAEYIKESNFKKFLLKNITLGQKASLLWAIGAGSVLTSEKNIHF